MPMLPARYGGYESPKDLAKDPLLSPEKRRNALKAWRGSLLRAVKHQEKDKRYEHLLEEIDTALEQVDH